MDLVIILGLCVVSTKSDVGEFLEAFHGLFGGRGLGVGCFPCGGLHGFLGFWSMVFRVWNLTSSVLSSLHVAGPLVPNLQQQITSVSSKR